jgi:integrase/recombinase XerD
MNTLSKELDRYLTIRRSLGYTLDKTERDLRRFIAFAGQQHANYVSTDLFLRWQTCFGHAKRPTWSARLGTVHLFAQWLHGLDPKHEVPPKALIPPRYRRARPYIYSDDEIRRIVEAAAELPSATGIRALTYATFFALIAVTGLRIGEAISLDDTDVDLEIGVLRIRRGKQGKERFVPVSDSTLAELKAYVQNRNRLLDSPPQSFFVSTRGSRLTENNAQYNFARLCQKIGLRAPEKLGRHGRGPRIHDRHTFASLLLQNGESLAYVKDQLGHASIKMTVDVYGHLVPGSNRQAVNRLPAITQDSEADVTSDRSGGLHKSWRTGDCQPR